MLASTHSLNAFIAWLGRIDRLALCPAMMACARLVPLAMHWRWQGIGLACAWPWLGVDCAPFRTPSCVGHYLTLFADHVYVVRCSLVSRCLIACALDAEFSREFSPASA